MLDFWPKTGLKEGMASTHNKARVERILCEVCIEILHFARAQEKRMPTPAEIKVVENFAAGLVTNELVAASDVSDEILRDGFRKHLEPGLRRWITGRIPS